MNTLAESWWAPHLRSELSQGDILEQAIVGSATIPPAYFAKGSSGKSGTEIWQRMSDWNQDNDGIGYYLARGRLTYCLVLSHDCEIDKEQKKSNILVAPVSKLNAVTELSAREAIIEQRRFPLMPLPDIPTIGECYADLRCVVYLHRKIINKSCKRIASLNDEGRLRLQAQLVGFFTRLDLGKCS